MAEHRTGTREEWEAAHEELLEREKELTRLNDARERMGWSFGWAHGVELRLGLERGQ